MAKVFEHQILYRKMKRLIEAVNKGEAETVPRKALIEYLKAPKSTTTRELLNLAKTKYAELSLKGSL